VKHREIGLSRDIIMVDISARRDEFSIVCGTVCICAGVEVSELSLYEH